MDALQGKVDSIEGELRQIGDSLRDYLDSGQTPARKVKPPGTKAGRELLQSLLGRLEQLSSQVGGIPKLTSGLTPLPTGPDTPLSYGSPVVQQSQSPSSQLRDTPRDTIPSPSPVVLSRPSHVDSPAEPNGALAATVLSKTPSIAPSNGRPESTSLQKGAPLLSDHASPLFPCTYRDVNVLHEDLFEELSRHPIVRDRGYFKLDVQDLPTLNVEKMARPTKDHATSFRYKTDSRGFIKVDTGARVSFRTPRLPFPRSAKAYWSLEEQKDLWNSTALDPPKGSLPYIIGNPLFEDVELSPGEKLLSRGRTKLEGINTQYVYFNLTGKTITTMHREDAHVRSENLLRSGANKFWCFVKPSSTARMEEQLRRIYPSMRACSQAVRHLSLHIPPFQLDRWGVEYTLDYCVPGQAIVTEPGTYHQVLNLGPNYAIAINVEYRSSPDFPIDYTFCDDNCPDKFAMSPEDFLIYPKELPEAGHADASVPSLPPTPGYASEKFLPYSNPNSPGLSSSPFNQDTLFPTPKQNPGLYRPGGGFSPKTVPPAFQAPRLASPPPDRVAQAAAALASMPNASPATPVLLPPANLVAVPPATSKALPPASSAIQPPTNPAILPPSSPAMLPPTSAASIPSASPAAQAPATISASSPVPQMVESPVPVPKPTKKQRTEPHPAPIPASAAAMPLPTQAFEPMPILTAASAPALSAGLVDGPAARKAAFHRLEQIVKEWRMITLSSTFPEGQLYDFMNHVDQMAYFNTSIYIFLRRLIRMKMAGLVYDVGNSEEEGRAGAIGDITNLLEKLGWDESNRRKLQHYIREGKCWNTICNNDDGMLCIMPLNTDMSDLAMFQEELRRFQSQLNNGFTAALVSIGRQLVAAIWEGRELTEFLWENHNTAELPPTDLLPLLQPYATITTKKSHYNMEEQSNAPRPVNWPAGYPWPSDPAVAKDGERHCNYCKRKKGCLCFKKRMPDVPRVEIDGSKGTGIRSRGEHQSGEMLGELLGDLVAPGSYPNEWTFELRRPDLKNELVADIYPGRCGNWVRKVNHSMDPTAQFTTVKMSGRWRVVLELLRDVQDGEEITAKFGRGYVKGSEHTTASLD
ncbi:JmjC domain, hydroxylase-domain-containing protein [Immersiella caudata]|uniref:JmjC domain, hydroxylase-domain-containing protein n=1 Tax=Immersiella caudata TaxID=314043 RepID=A0AA40CDR7_9PEZI|nr:JmjC domain, hydroxylase-domain-containing protein [Immersiella caudata]